MRQNQNSRRSRGRVGNGRNQNQNGKPASDNRQPNRKGFSTTNRQYESQGPDGKNRGTASQLYERYKTLSREFMASDRILAEAFSQFADHYYRLAVEAAGYDIEAGPRPQVQQGHDENQADGVETGNFIDGVDQYANGSPPRIMSHDDAASGQAKPSNGEENDAPRVRESEDRPEGRSEGRVARSEENGRDNRLRTDGSRDGMRRPRMDNRGERRFVADEKREQPAQLALDVADKTRETSVVRETGTERQSVQQPAFHVERQPEPYRARASETTSEFVEQSPTPIREPRRVVNRSDTPVVVEKKTRRRIVTTKPGEAEVPSAQTTPEPVAVTAFEPVAVSEETAVAPRRRGRPRKVAPTTEDA